MHNKVEKQFSIEKFVISFDRKFDKDFAFAGESHNFWEIVFVEKGKIEVTEEENIYVLSEGDILFHSPSEFHRLKSADNTSPKVLNLSFTAKGVLPHVLQDGIFKLGIEDRKEFIRVFKIAENFLLGKDSDNYSGQEAADGLTSFILRIFRNITAKNKPSNSTGAIAYRKLVETMNDSVLSNISISELAEKNYMSVSYVKALFNRYAGISPKSYYTNLRLFEATRLLSEDISIKEIAERMGFSSPNYFTLFFKKHAGVTPMQYKKNQLK